ncbi:short-chain dehydrogenase [Pedobacter sp. PACM 27299]|uniref:SDR family NAD(P)-dependent oxidoreductase n=1 Tax=Pedobacter sp. PACM 27299 TaxID=1727164 RepID=UPI000706BF2F|nr:SDR family NAD(P)-dependent oxidoreductase [Pedobacter sp. PACM 27299]ALL05953.1 short-chain dehydrogenase [Pedobacter sp. PACM 27299]
MKKTILITGASRGFGKIWAEAFLKRGDQVIATARNIESLKGLVETYGSSMLALELDVTNRAQTFEVIGKAHTHFGGLDVVINNAGYGLFGTIEEASEQEAREQFEVNVFGTLWLSQAAIPLMRAQGTGHIIQVSSVLGIASIPNLGLYNASKWAVEALSEAMAAEIKQFGIHTTLVEPIGYSTDWSGASAVHSKTIDVYDGLRAAVYKEMENMPFGHPDATADAILKVVDAEVPPLRIFFGKTALPWINQVYADRLAGWEEWSEVSVAAHG